MISSPIGHRKATSADLDQIYRTTLQRLRQASPTQEHVLSFWRDLDEISKARLASQVDDVDFGLLEDCGACQQNADSAFSPPPILSLLDQSLNEQARRAGERLLSAGRVAVVIVAGGMGSRLGFECPKGMLPIGPVSGRTLFQILIERIIALGRRYDAPIPLYLMTSPITHEATVQFFETNQLFGLHSEDLRIFCQGTIPAIDAKTRRLLLSSPAELATCPDGHGGLLDSAQKAGVFEDMSRRGVDVLCFGQIDNPIQPIADPTHLGRHVLSEADVTTQVVRKSHGSEKLGTLVASNEQIIVVEYGELPDQAANATLADGSPVYWAGNSGGYIFQVPFLRRIASRPHALPLHPRVQMLPHIDDRGQVVRPREPNAIKFERFIFDVLHHTTKTLLVEIDRATAFAPVKNDDSAGIHTPSTAKAAMSHVHAEWLRRAGAVVAPDVAVEISPFFSIDGTDLVEKTVPANVDQPLFLVEFGRNGWQEKQTE